MTDKLFNELIVTGECICNSPKVRNSLYKRLKQQGIKYQTETVGDNGPGKDICRSSGNFNWNSKVITHWFNSGRFYKQDMLDAYCDTWNFDKADIHELFETTDKQRIYNLIDKMCGSGKYCIFDFTPLRKLVKKIKIA